MIHLLPPLTSPAARFTLFQGAKYTSLSARPRERSGIFLSRLLFTPSLSSHAGRAAIYNTRKGNKPAASTRYLAPGAHSVRLASKAKYLSLRCPMSIPALSPSVEIVENHPVTSSRKVAEYFGKRHDNVLRDIQSLPCSPEFTELNFEASEYTDSTGRKLPEYLLTKNGFVFLVMGFTGAKAAKLKEAYIAEFDRMEETLRKREGGALAEHRLGTLSPIRQDLLRRAVVRKAEDAGVPPGKIWYRLMDAFRMPSHLHLAPEFFDRALLYLETLDLSNEARTKKLSDIKKIGGGA